MSCSFIRRPGWAFAPEARTGRAAWILLGLASFLLVLLFLITHEHWVPAPTVDVVRVSAVAKTPTTMPQAETAHASAPQAPATVAFGAAGWIEAAPQAVRVSAFTEGVVNEILVYEGARIDAGQVVARIDATDHRLAARAAEADLAEAQAVRQQRLASARRATVERRLDEHRRREDEPRLADAEDAHRRLVDSGEAASERQVQAAAAVLAEARARQERLATAVELAAAKEAEAAATVAQAAARVDRLQVAVDQARLAVERTTIRSPVAGMVQRLHKQPGDKIRFGMDDPVSAAVVTCYDPAHLQVRVDVSLADAGGLHLGQAARLTSAVTGDRAFDGEVVRIEGEADIARNTLQAKVLIEDPDPRLRPEMLCRVQFLSHGGGDTATATATGPTTDSGRLLLSLPAGRIDAAPQASARLWIVDAEQRARPRQVRFGRRASDRLVVADGLHAGDWVIVDPPAELTDGARVSVRHQP